MWNGDFPVPGSARVADDAGAAARRAVPGQCPGGRLFSGLAAIDPRACAGDPCFDAVDYLLDGAGSMEWTPAARPWQKRRGWISDG
jgi:hypothetical protein